MKNIQISLRQLFKRIDFKKSDKKHRINFKTIAIVKRQQTHLVSCINSIVPTKPNIDLITNMNKNSFSSATKQIEP